MPNDCADKPPAPTAIDVHSHLVPKGWPDLAEAVGPGTDWPRLRVESEREAMILLGDREFRRITSDAWDADVRLADMDNEGVEVQVVSPTPVFFAYGRPADQAIKVARIFNDLTLEVCAPAPERLWPFCQVPLQDPEAACVEVDRCRDAGFRGVEVGNHVGDRDLDDPGIEMFLQHCADQGIPVFVHPWDMPVNVRNDRWMAQWLAGMPAETHLSITALILGGVLDRVSTDLRICFAHGGGSFAYWLGRMDNAWHRRHDIIGTSEHPPSHYVDRMYVDSVVFDDRPLRLLLDVMGSDRVVMGSDYPYPLGERPAGGVVRRTALLSEEEKTLVLRDNALSFLGVSAPRRIIRSGRAQA